MRRNVHQQPGGHPAVRRIEVRVEQPEVAPEVARLIIRQALEIVAEAARRRRGDGR